MRAFVAVELPPHVRSTVQTAVAPVRESHPELAWTRPERWHLTLTFLAELPEDRVPEPAGSAANGQCSGAWPSAPPRPAGGADSMCRTPATART